MSSLFISFVLILIMKIKKEGKIAYATSIATVIFFDGMFSLIPGILLLFINKFYTVEKLNSSANSNTDSLIILESKFLMITFSGKFKLAYNYFYRFVYLVCYFSNINCY